jgi:formylglycine-generating enzyme required for sulfatase activity
MRTTVSLTLLLFMLLAPAAEAKRVALVIGIADYQYEPALKNPVRDARLLYGVFKTDLKFDVVQELDNPDRSSLAKAIIQFAQQAQRADVAVIYFSGHGMQSAQRRNYLIPSDIKVDGDADLKVNAIAAEDLVDALVGARIKLVILDACRDSPRGKKGGPKGLARINNESDETLIAYATEEGKTAEDGAGNNSPYALALAENLRQTGKPILIQFDAVARTVRRSVPGQNPQRSGSLEADFDKIGALNVAPDLQVAAWDRFLANYVQDNPFSGEDKRLRALAQEQKRKAATSATAQQAKLEKHSALTEIPLCAPIGSEAAKRNPNSKKCRKLAYRLDCADCPKMRILPAGNITLFGENGPQVNVSIPSFALGETLVTQGQWRAIMGNNPSHFSGCGDTCPVETVSWDDVRQYLQRLSKKTGQTYRLPTEAEWEYACMAGNTTTYCGGEDLDSVAWYGNGGQPGGNSGQSTHPVATKQPNDFGLYDMSGNVSEWMQDCFHSDCMDDGRILRGGSWGYAPNGLRAANRYKFVASFRYDNFGFRVARTAP